MDKTYDAINSSNPNRDRTKCSNCIYNQNAHCIYVKLDGFCFINGVKVAKDYTYGKSLTDDTIHR